jgi:uncharacterized lipoprotein YmbA
MKRIFVLVVVLVLTGCTSPAIEKARYDAQAQQAQSNAVIAQSNASIASSKAEVERFQILAAAAKPDYTPLIALVLVIVMIDLTFIFA